MKNLLDMTRQQLEYQFSKEMGCESYDYFPKTYSLVTTEDLINTIEDQRGIDKLDAT